MEAADYEVLSVREQLFHDRVRECIVSPGPGREGAGPRWEGRRGGDGKSCRPSSEDLDPCERRGRDGELSGRVGWVSEP